VLALAGAAVVELRAPRQPLFDFCTYYAAGSLVAEGRAPAAYDATELRRRHQELHPGPRGVGPFFYSPVWLPVAASFAALPIAAADRANRWLGVGCLAAGLGFLLSRVAGGWAQLGLTAVFVLAHPVWAQLVYGNWSFLLFALLAAAWTLEARGRSGAAAVAWAFAVHLKLYAGFGLLALAVTGRRRLAARALIAGLALGVAVLPLVGTESYRRYFGGIPAASAAGLTPFYNQVSLQATAARFASEPRAWIAPRGPVELPGLRWLFLAGLPLLALGLARLRRASDAALAFALAWTLLFVPQIWDHTEILLLLVLPALTRRHALAVGALLAASVVYQPFLQPLLLETLRGESPPAALRALLLFFPSLNLLALAAALAAPPPSAEASATLAGGDAGAAGSVGLPGGAPPPDRG
jgi:hypothetical protein